MAYSCLMNEIAIVSGMYPVYLYSESDSVNEDSVWCPSVPGFHKSLDSLVNSQHNLILQDISLKNDFLGEDDQYETTRSDSFQGTEDAIVHGNDLRHI